MKWILALLLRLNLNGAQENSEYKNITIDENQCDKFLRSHEIDLYYKMDFNYKDNINEFITDNLMIILKSNLYDFDLGEEILNKVDFQLINIEDYSLTIKFDNKPNERLLKNTLIKNFDVFLFNYDKLEVIKEYIQKNFWVPKELLNSEKDIIFNYIKNNFRKEFNNICINNIYLNNEKDFFEYLDIKKIEQNYIVLNFLNNTQFTIMIKEQ